jgi:hypothetical protein
LEQRFWLSSALCQRSQRQSSACDFGRRSPGSNPDLVVRNREGKVDSVLWEAVYAMMLNEFVKEHRKVDELEKGMEVLKAQAAQIQKVSAQLEASKPAPKVVVNTP